MNKNLLILCGLFLLAACGGGSGGGGGSNANIRQPVVNNNAKVTSLNTTVDNRAETIAFVEGILGETYYIHGATNEDGRPSPRGGTNRAAALNTEAYQKYMKKYNSAFNKISDMYIILSKDRATLEELLASDDKGATRLKDSLLLAGKTIPENATNKQLLDLADTVSAIEALAIRDAYALKTVKLDEVSLVKAESNQNTKKTYKFKLDEKGQIVGITLVGWQEMTRVGDSNIFTTRVSNGSGGYFDEQLTVESYGKKVGLSYTDFGNLFTKTREHDADGNVIGNSQTSDAFAGGYEYKKIADTAIAAKMKVDTEMNFKGRAVGTVQNNSTNDRLLVDGSATLNFKQTGEQTLKANFSEGTATGSTAWYDTVLTKNANGKYDIAFDNTKGVTIDEKFKVKGAQDINSNTNNMAEINYYGDAGNASEASGIIHYTEGDVELKSSFGVKKVD